MIRNIFIIALLVLMSYIPVITEASDTTVVNLSNQVTEKQEVKLPWYKNMNYTFGYNIGLCLRGEDLNSYPHGGVDVVGDILGKFYWLNSIEAGVRIPVENRMIDVGLGYGWAYMSGPDLTIKYIYTYIAYSTSKNVIPGLELNYFQGNRTEYHTISGEHIIVPNVRRDFIGGGWHIRFCNTRKNKRKFRFDPYFMIRIGGAYEINNTSPYHESDKKLVIWYTGLYAGFNFNIGRKR